MYINTETNEYPVSEQAIRVVFQNTSFGDPFVAPEPYAWVFPVPMPVHDSITQFVREVAPTLTVLGHWEQQWEIVQFTAEQAEANEVAANADAVVRIAEKVNALWKAADDYVGGYISGVAVGILTIGVIQQKPKALAVSAWSSSIWGSYYERKALITVSSIDDHDFTSFGPIPHSVPELQAEVSL